MNTTQVSNKYSNDIMISDKKQNEQYTEHETLKIESLKKPTKSLSINTQDRLINGKIFNISKYGINYNKLSIQDQQQL
jgi:hypothetical protein